MFRAFYATILVSTNASAASSHNCYNFIVQQLAATSELFTTVAATYIIQFHIFQVSGTVLSKYKLAKKLILNRARAIPTTEAPSVSREDIAHSTSRNIPALETAKQLPCEDSLSVFGSRTNN